jgi:ABC-type multidrug transport system ATPase subunit
LSLVTNSTVTLNVSTTSFPLYYQKESVTTKQAASATTFIFCAITFQFVMMLYNVVSEKDLKLRQGLKLIGLKDSVYWMTWAVTGFVIAFFSTLILMITGYACQLKFFLNTEPDIIFLLFFIYSASMVPLAFFASVFLSTVRQAVNVGMVVFVVGLMVISLLSNQFLLIELYQYVMPLVAVLSFLPPFHLAKAMSDIGSAGSATDISGLPQESYYFDWEQMTRDRTERIPNTDSNTNSYTTVFLPPTYASLLFLIGDAILYGVLAWYLDGVIRGNHGIPRKLYFPFQLSYWLPTKGKSPSSGQQRSVLQDTDNDQDTSDEDDVPLLTKGYKLGASDAMEVHTLRKTFSTGLCGRGNVKVAVDGLSLKVQESQILALLGHNGAGKSTTINMLTGLLEPDQGNAYFYGLTITEDLDAIRNILGVCPQHDVLWGDLTAYEHMQLFGHLKGIPRENMATEIQALLDEVQLNHVANHRVRTYSGGMKRRLSVALSFLGDPSIIFLDEPTTGMDPRIRRDIWNLILRKKQGRVTVMTTHSMEEADILGNNIAIMAAGTLRVMGTSVNLKNRFAGYNIELVVRHQDREAMEVLVREKLPGSTRKSDPVEVEGGVLLPYNLPPDRQAEIVPFFTVIERERSLADKILDYSISQTTLEEVFLNVTVGELFRDQEYQPALLRSHSHTTPLSPLSPEPHGSKKQLSDLSQ